MLVFLFLTACNPDFNTNQKDVKHQSSKKRLKSKTEVTQNQEANKNQEVDQNQRTKNTLLNDLRNLIEKVNKDRTKYVKRLEEESSEQYKILAFKELSWKETKETAADNSEKAKI